jgi:hypothetical protein
VKGLDRLFAAAVCVGAGVYILNGGKSWFELVAYGMGIYFIGKGLFVWESLREQHRAAHALEHLARHANPEVAYQPPGLTGRWASAATVAAAVGAVVLLVALNSSEDSATPSSPAPDPDELVTDRNGYPCLARNIDADGICQE